MSEESTNNNMDNPDNPAPQANQEASSTPIEDAHPESWPALIWKIFQKPKIVLYILLSILILAVVIIFGAKFAGYDLIDRFLPSNKKQSLEIQSLTILLRLNDDKGESKHNRLISVRTIYSIKANKNLTINDTAFIKSYSKSYALDMKEWIGTAKERIYSSSPTHKKSYVYFEVNGGESMTYVAGTNVLYNLPLPKGRNIRNIISLESDEDWWGYPNEHGYTIPEITILVESNTTNLYYPEHSPAVRITENGTSSSSNVDVGPLKNVFANQGALTAHWTNVKPKELVALRFKWK